MRNSTIAIILLLFSILLLKGCSSNRKSKLDFSSPGNVLQAVFSAAKSGDFFELKGLCDPLKKNDGDTSDICEINKKHPDKNQFIEDFKLARLQGAVHVLGNRAKVPFVYGPKADKKEVMHLIKRKTKWYLYKY